MKKQLILGLVLFSPFIMFLLSPPIIAFGWHLGFLMASKNLIFSLISITGLALIVGS